MEWRVRHRQPKGTVTDGPSCTSPRRLSTRPLIKGGSQEKGRRGLQGEGEKGDHRRRGERGSQEKERNTITTGSHSPVLLSSRFSHSPVVPILPFSCRPDSPILLSSRFSHSPVVPILPFSCRPDSPVLLSSRFSRSPVVPNSPVLLLAPISGRPALRACSCSARPATDCSRT
jgi:hypothetical protein